MTKLNLDKLNPDKNKIVVAILALAVLILLVWLISSIFNLGSDKKEKQAETADVQVINDTPVIPNTVQVHANEGEYIPRGEYNIKLQPKSESEMVVVANAVLTLKQSYDLAVIEGVKWSMDAKLVFIKSLGAIDLEGKSSAWQIIFGSASQEQGYEVIIQGDQVISQKEIIVESAGWDLPSNWYDGRDAIISLQSLPQFSDDTVSSITFYYNQSAESWAYGLATGNGEKTTSMWVK